MSALVTSVILTMALLTPNLAVPLPKLPAIECMLPPGQCPAGSVPTTSGNASSETRGQRDTGNGAVPATSGNFGSGTAKTAFLTLEEYASHAADEAGIDPVQFQRLIRCESQWKEDAAGDHGTSLGILQFKKPTFELFLKKYPIPDADMDNPRHQIDLATAMIANGYLHHWKNCSRKIGWSAKI